MNEMQLTTLSLKAIWCDVVSPFSFNLYILNGISMHRGRIINDLWILKRIFYLSGHMGSLFIMNVIEKKKQLTMVYAGR